MFQVSVKVFQGCSVFKVHCCMSFIAATQAEGGLVLKISWWVGRWPYSFSVLKHAYDHKTEILFRNLQNKLLFKKYCKAGYVQHHECFVNVQVPCPHCNIYIKFWLVAFSWKCLLFCFCVHGQCRVCYTFYMEFHFRLGHLTPFPVQGQ